MQLFSAIFSYKITTIHLVFVIEQKYSLMNCAEKRFCESKAVSLLCWPVLFCAINKLSFTFLVGYGLKMAVPVPNLLTSNFTNLLECYLLCALPAESDPWTTWSPWNPCSISCGWGNTIRERACLGDYCHGSLREARACADQACPGERLLT